MTRPYTAPGAYFEAQDLPRPVVTPIRTDVAGFVGVADRGPLNRPVRVESWEQFVTRFGGLTPAGLLGYAVRAFFDNGGRTCFVVRAGDPTAADHAAATVPVPGAAARLRVTAVDPDLGREEITVEAVPRPGGRFTLVVRVDGRERERWTDLLAAPAEDERLAPPEQSRFVNRVLGEHTGRSALVWAAVEPRPSPEPPSGPVRLTGPGRGPWFPLDGLTVDHLTGDAGGPDRLWGLRALELCPEVSVVAVPDLVWVAPPERVSRPPFRRCGDPTPEVPAGPARVGRRPFDPDDVLRGQQAVIAHCAGLKDRFAVLDTPAGDAPGDVVHRAVRLRSASAASGYAALYHPWVLVPDPLGETVGSLRAVPPSGAVAGVMARVDLSAGVHRAPANELVRTAHGVVSELGEPDRAYLNEAGVNAVVPVPGRGVRVYGARTLSPPDQPEWRYVPARRLVMMIEAAIDRMAQQVVFGGNGPGERADLARAVRAFLDRLWRDGRLSGRTADEAYAVACDDRTTTPEDVAAGRMVCVIGVRPPDPAEFVVIRVGVTAGETAEVGGG